MTHHCGQDGDCFIAGCDIPDNVKCGNSNGWRAAAYANADEVLRLTAANDGLRDTVDYLNRYIEQLLQTIEHLESENHLLSDHISALEQENRRFVDRVVMLEDRLASSGGCA